MLEFWNLGHILLFGLIVVFFRHSWKWYQSKVLWMQLLTILLLTGILSFIIELSQYIFANGTPDLFDIRRNFAGAILGFVFTTGLGRKSLQNILKLTVLIWVGLELIPIGRALADEISGYLDFPVLADFETQLELSRWTGDEQFVRSDEYVKHGNHALKVTFGRQQYSGIALNHFPDDWTGYSFLKYDVFYPGTDTLKFTCRIHDAEHIRGVQEYRDRYNCSFQLFPGWNEITIPLRDVNNAPRDRKMDMTHIMSVGIFTIQLPEPKIAWFDYFRLE